MTGTWLEIEPDPERSLVYYHEDEVITIPVKDGRDVKLLKYINTETTGNFFIAWNFVAFEDREDAAFFKLRFGV